MRERTYVCPTCGATKILRAEFYQSTYEFEQDLPDSLPCGWRGCKDEAKP